MQITSPLPTHSTVSRQSIDLEGMPSLSSASALFLDFDGTLVDIASQPELVVVPAELPALLAALSKKLGGALAIVSGRGLEDLDHFLAPLTLPCAAEHGAVMRLDKTAITHIDAPRLQEIRRVALALAAEHAGLRVEIKSAAVALHYRHAPELEAICLSVMAEVVKRTPGVDLMQGKFVIEVKPASVSKGMAIQSFMAHPPFAGRPPVFCGDDTTDESGFSAVNTIGGGSVKIGEGTTAANHRCASPAALRQWLQSVVGALA